MSKAVVVLQDTYFDSVVLMGAASQVKKLPGMVEVAFFMGTEANKVLLGNVGLRLPEVDAATPSDTILAVEAEDEAGAAQALAEAKEVLSGKRKTGQAQQTLPRSLGGAIRQTEGANLAVISVPGRYAEAEALRALTSGLNVFLFSDNVPVEGEVRLKNEAVRRGLLCMGPDCGTAWINGVGIGFSNAVPRGRVGLISASGTGAQAVACRLAENGEGLSHCLGVGGRDLSQEVGGLMTLQALKMLEADAATEAILIISKPPHPAVLAKLEEALRSVRKPVVVACLGAQPRVEGNVCWVSWLAEAADTLAARLRGKTPVCGAALPEFDDPAAVRAVLEEHAGAAGPLLGVYVGGTLAHEGELAVNAQLGETVAFGDEQALAQGRSVIVDLGDDVFTQGRPHPMIDPSLRNDYLLRALKAGVGVVLFDVVIGRCSHEDPAGVFAQAIAEAARQGLRPVFVGSVVGVEDDAQKLGRQIETLRAAGAIILHNNAQAARLAALLASPQRRAAYLSGARG
ncbi:MAG TPA: acyl-CoA synthetase FdrA [Candidatus Avidesulfovibrio excrementigallinarum]|nr:acyl-CoA synthetase FdrA [Candidatus Avidesulfovibrio excrementigallinarum]